MEQQIQQLLSQIELEKDIQILFACESGSRAWGFPSPDSDYDIRFIYRHKLDWYFSIVDGKDNIVRMPNELLDASGWDIKKVLHLLYKSNASIFEWLQSPILYRKEEAFVNELINLSKNYFLPKKIAYHYLGIATGMLKKEFQEDQVKIKKYFYVLRPVLAAKWAIQKQTPPPILFQDLLVLVDQKLVVKNIQRLLKKKEIAVEGERINRIPFLDEFINKEMEQCEQALKEISKSENDKEALNHFYRRVVKSAWPKK